jgi:hypothetical protein
MSDCYTSSDDETRYSSSDDEQDGYCYYCECDLEYEDDVFTDLEPCKTRYYCSRCKMHIHTDDLDSD